ncbi:MAG: MBOAT family O-acyltransferase [Chitinophagaceae bacterium]
MLFNSLEFILFFPIVTLTYFLIPHKFRWIQLFIASCIFYASFIPSYLLILFALILIDFFAGILIEKSASKKFWLIISIVANLGLLFLFKYFNFFVANINSLYGTQFILLHFALPIGLSFHTFQSLSYTTEVFRGRQKAIRHLGYYSLYVMFYPQLVAGPIERPYHLLPQLQQKHSFSAQNLYEGLRLMAWGFFKKTVIADRLSNYVDAIFTNPSHFHSYNIWIAVIFFTIQIYADFSGYSDIAIGAARCIGIELMTNFNRPYQSWNVREFWKRWHISLSSWFRDYVYIPLGGNRKGVFRKNVNIMITFILSGFWHGAGWNFMLWGVLHGIYMLIYVFYVDNFKKTKIPVFVSYLLTMIAISFAWIFFRSSNLKNAISIIRKSFSFDQFSFQDLASLSTPTFQYGSFSMALIFTCSVLMFGVEKYTTPLLTNLNRNKIADVLLFTIIVLLIIFYGVFHKTSFIYFQF